MHLDFLHPRRRVSGLGWLLLVLGLSALAALLSWYVLELEPRVRAGEAELRGLQNAWTARQPVTQTLSDEQLVTDWAQAASVAQQLATPWPGLFAEIEGAGGDDVALLSLEPDGVRHELVLNGEARNYEALLDYYRYLQQQPMLKTVVLQTHQVNHQDRDQPIRFRITAHWERVS
jgi:Tfp pilus assembly protein PilN